jgi:hypothetical protein
VLWKVEGKGKFFFLSPLLPLSSPYNSLLSLFLSTKKLTEESHIAYGR